VLRRISRLWAYRDSDGQGLTEYGLVLVFISLIGIYFCITTGDGTRKLIGATPDALTTIS
jgi:Flp pilus assembly pilin Flp